MSSLSVHLPLAYSELDGYEMNKDLKSLFRQNLKMLILTNPGERVMKPSFGVGLQQYLFQNFTQSTYAEIENRIRSQVKTYIPAIALGRIAFASPNVDNNQLQVSISFSIPNIGVKDLLEFTI
mgnify:FL=1|jgi:phage baseplate assembly protein W